MGLPSEISLNSTSQTKALKKIVQSLIVFIHDIRRKAVGITQVKKQESMPKTMTKRKKAQPQKNKITPLQVIEF